MKRIMMLCLLMAATSSMIWAQKGLKSVGVGAEWRYGNIGRFEWYGIAPITTFQYNFTDHIRASATLGYLIPFDSYDYSYSSYSTDDYDERLKGNSMFKGISIGLESHFLIGTASNRIRPYGIVGLNVGQYSYRKEKNRYTSNGWGNHSSETLYIIEYEGSKSVAIAGVAGLGCDFRLTYNLTLQFEGKVHIGPYKNCDTWPVINAGLGLIYSF